MTKIIRINNIVRNDLSVVADLNIDGNAEQLEINVNTNCIPYLTIDRIDFIVVGFLYFAMKNDYDIESKLPMTQDLWYNIVYHFIPQFALGNPHLHKTNIKCPFVGKIDPSTKMYNATGISCGVDSLYTVATNTSKEIPVENRLNALCFFNVGAAMKGKEELRTPLVAGRLKIAENFANEYHFPFFFIESNIHILINKYSNYSHIEMHTYMGMFCVLLIQKGIKQYHYSSGYTLLDFSITNKDNLIFDCAHYEFLIFSTLSAIGISAFSEGADVDRKNKIAKLVKWSPSYNYLNVCVDKVDNCGLCFKCIRTLLEIDALGDIDNYRKVFDIDFYKTHRKKYLRRLYLDSLKSNDMFLKELVPYFKDELTIVFKFKCLASVIINRILRKREIL